MNESLEQKQTQKCDGKEERTKYDEWIEETDWLKEKDMPVALVMTEVLKPSEGEDAIIFPPTYAVKKGDPYQIDVLRTDIPPQAAKNGEEVNNCLIDSVGSQANRMEPCFKEVRSKVNKLSELVPQIRINFKVKAKNEDNDIPRESEVRVSEVNLLDIGHRIADGAVRFTPGLSDEVKNAITEMKDNANAEPLAKLAPTSLVFGFWDSRPDTTMFKHARILTSTIRATNVSVIKRSAQYRPTFDPNLLDIAEDIPDEKTSNQIDEENDKSEKETKKNENIDIYSQLGLRAVPSVGTHGGVRVYGNIIRRTQINLVAIRALAVTTKKGNNIEIDKDRTIKLRRYILGLALLASIVQKNYALRQGCILVRKSPVETKLVYTDNKEISNPIDVNDFEGIFKYAKESANDFGVGESKKYDFDITELNTKLNERGLRGKPKAEKRKKEEIKKKEE